VIAQHTLTAASVALTHNSHRSRISVASIANALPKLAATIDGLLSLAMFGFAGNRAWDCGALLQINALFWLALSGLAATRLLCATFALFGLDRVVRTEDGEFRERALFGFGVRTALD
jgi:hypothetical protein